MKKLRNAKLQLGKSEPAATVPTPVLSEAEGPERGNDLNKLAYSAILEWGLPATFPQFMVPDEVGEFTLEFTGSLLFFAWAMATQNGWDPYLRHLPHVADNCYGFGLTINGLVVPLMCKLGTPENENGDGSHAPAWEPKT